MLFHWHHLDRIRPICLPVRRSTQIRSYVGSNVFVAGWGKIEENGSYSPVLLQVQIPIINNNDCKKIYKKIGEFKEDIQFDKHVICAGTLQGGKDSCKGDSGGPLMLPINLNNGYFPFYQIGVVSYGYGCGKSNIPGVYANVVEYADWIEMKLKK